MKLKILIILVLSISMIVLSGCWNYRDIENMDIVTGMAIDIDKKTGNYILTIEIVNQQSSEEKADKSTGLKSIFVESEGSTIFDAIRNAIIKVGNKPFYGHCKVVIVSQDIARKGIIPAIDFVFRGAEVRHDLWLLISLDNTAGEILKEANLSGGIVSFYLNDTLNSVKHVSTYIADDLLEFVKALNVKTTSVLAPAVRTAAYNDRIVPEINGSGVFKHDKLVYFLNGDESKTALLIRNELNGGILPINENATGDNIKISLEILNSEVKLTPNIVNNRIVMQISAEIDVSMAELQGSEDYINKDIREVLKKDMGNLLAGKINDLVKKTQNNFSTDIFNFSGTIQRKMPDYWKIIEPNWDEYYENIKVRPNIKIEILYTGVLQKPIQVGE